MVRSSRRKLRSSRRFRLALVCVGLCGLAIGAGLWAASFLMENGRLRLFGTVYVLGSGALLAASRAIELIDKIKKRKYKKR